MVPRLLSPLLLVVAIAASSNAFAGELKNDLDDCDDMSVEANDDDDAPDLSDREVVVPCAMAESGALGPACTDAAFYVVNQHGTLLCRVELTMFTNATTTPIVEQAPAAPAGGPHFSVVAALVPTLPPLPRAAVFVDVDPVFAADLLGAADAHVYDRPRPS